jgi:hypothetical protein
MRLARMLAVPAEGSGRTIQARTRFCTNCGKLYPAEAEEPRYPHRERVCENCGLGVLLSTDMEMLTRDGMPFLVVKGDLSISAASEAALNLFEIDWSEMIGKPVLSLLDSPIRGAELADRVSRAAGGAGDVSLLRVQLRGWPYDVRVGRCGAPRGALVVFESRR